MRWGNIQKGKNILCRRSRVFASDLFQVIDKTVGIHNNSGTGRKCRDEGRADSAFSHREVCTPDKNALVLSRVL